MDGKGDRKLPFGNQATRIQKFFYDKRGLIDSTLLPQARVVEKYSYNARKWLDSMAATKGINTLFKQRLEFDYVGNIQVQSTKHLGQDSVYIEHQYDDLSRLRLWSENNFSFGDSYTYDSVGNRKTQGVFAGSDVPAYTNTYEYGNGNNQLTKVTYPTIATATTYKYTGDGALRVRQKREDLGHSYSVVDRDVFGYGYNGLLKTYGFSHWEGAYIGCRMDTNSAPQWQWQYRYSAGGERESKRMTTGIMDGLGWDKPHSWTYYLLGGNKQQLAVYNGRETTFPNVCLDSGHRVHFYPTEYLTYGNMTSALISTRPNDKVEYKIVDHLDTTRVVLNDTGKVIGTNDFEPFGKVLVQTGVVPRKSFIDKEKDRENRLGNFGVRQMDDGIGRFTSIDPMWEKYRSWTLYQYAGNNPLKLMDPSGKDWLLFSGKTVDWYSGKYGDRSKRLYSFKATSGLPGYQNSRYQYYKGKDGEGAGPTPQGKYSINLKLDPSRTSKEVTLKDGTYLTPGKGIQKMPTDGLGNSLYPNWGTQRGRLEEDKGTNTGGRQNMYLHDSEKGFSHGCIEVQKDIFNTLIDYSKNNSKIEVMVDYPDNNTSTNGGTKK